MKNFLVTILAFIYLTTSSEATISLHYCMGKLYAVDFVNHSKCGKCGMKNGKGDCCKDEFKVIKVQDNHQLISNEINLVSPVALLDSHQNNFIPALIYVVPQLTTHNNSPPGSSGISLCIFNCVFRI